jgi:hypothetical protein
MVTKEKRSEKDLVSFVDSEEFLDMSQVKRNEARAELCAIRKARFHREHREELEGNVP